jgi:hypothetical protein
MHSTNLHDSLGHAPFSSLYSQLLNRPGLSLAASGLVLYSRGTERAENTVLLLHSSDYTSRGSYLASPLARWLLRSSEHLFYCCLRVSRAVHRAVAWQCVDMSQYLFLWIQNPKFCRRKAGREWRTLPPSYPSGPIPHIMPFTDTWA